MDDFLDFGFASDSEVASALGTRLKAARLAQGLRQSDLAARAGISPGTLKTLENQGNCTLLTFIQVIRALGLEWHLQDSFKLAPPQSIASMQTQALQVRKRASRKAPR